MIVALDRIGYGWKGDCLFLSLSIVNCELFLKHWGRLRDVSKWNVLKNGILDLEFGGFFSSFFNLGFHGLWRWSIIQSVKMVVFLTRLIYSRNVFIYFLRILYDPHKITNKSFVKKMWKLLTNTWNNQIPSIEAAN